MNFKPLKALVIFIVIITVLNILLFLGVGNGFINRATSLVSSGVDSSQSFISSLVENSKSKSDLVTENKLLSEKVQQLESDLAMAEMQVATLESQVDATQQLVSYDNAELVSTEIISRSFYDWTKTATINVGEDDGITVGMPVLSQGTFVGVIDSVNKNSSTINLSTSENVLLNIPVYGLNENKEKNGLVKSYSFETNTYDLETLSEYDVLEKGDLIYTNGYMDGVPKGLLVGQVVDVIEDDFGKTYKVVPTTDSTNMRYLEVLINVT